jgi:hypothetical protein
VTKSGFENPKELCASLSVEPAPSRNFEHRRFQTACLLNWNLDGESLLLQRSACTDPIGLHAKQVWARDMARTAIGCVGASTKPQLDPSLTESRVGPPVEKGKCIFPGCHPPFFPKKNPHQ